MGGHELQELLVVLDASLGFEVDADVPLLVDVQEGHGLLVVLDHSGGDD